MTFLVQLALFAWSFGSFFGSDGIFYFARKLEHPGQAMAVFTAPDDRGHYRPLTLVFFSFVLYPMFKLGPTGYHAVAFLFHFSNTILSFFLFRKLLPGWLATAAATLFFGLHPVDFYVSFGISFLPDFTYAFFYLLALLCLLSYQDTQRRSRLALGAGAFVLALLCKEAAVTIPAVAAVLALARSRFDWRRSLPALSLCAGILCIYLVFLVSIKKGSLFPADPHDPYRGSFRLSTVMAKGPYLFWGLGLPTGTGTLKGHPRAMALLEQLLPESFVRAAGDISNVIVLGPSAARVALMLPLAFLLTLGIATQARRQPMVLGGLVWFVIGLAPVLFLAAKTMRHNLYVPVLGLSLVAGLITQEVHSWIRRRSRSWAIAILVWLLAAYITSAAVAVHSYWKKAWPVQTSVAAENALADLARLRPERSQVSTLYFLDNHRDDLIWLFEGGNLFRLFYGDASLRTLFEQSGQVLSNEDLFASKTVVLAYDAGSLYDWTEAYRAERRDHTSYRLLDSYDPRNVVFDRRERYPLGDFLNSPSGQPVFPYCFARGGQWRRALVTLAGAGVPLRLPPLKPGSVLHVSAAMVHDLGDGAEGRIWFVSEHGKELLYSQMLDPAHRPDDRRWFDSTIDMTAFAGRPATLLLECRSGEAGDTAADWFAWSNLRIAQP
jgi:hypothetical protein